MSVGDRSRRQHKDKNYFAKKNTLWSIVDANFGKKLLEINLERYFYYLKFGGLRTLPRRGTPASGGRRRGAGGSPSVAGGVSTIIANPFPRSGVGSEIKIF